MISRRSTDCRSISCSTNLFGHHHRHLHILSEARKYRLQLTLATQYLDQVPQDILSAVFGNIGTYVSLRLGPDDAREMAKQFGIDGRAFLDLQNFTGRIRPLIDGNPGTNEYVVMLPPPPRFTIGPAGSFKTRLHGLLASAKRSKPGSKACSRCSGQLDTLPGCILNPNWGEHMRRLLLGTLMLLTCTSECSAHGAIASGYAGSLIRFVGVTNVSTIAGSKLHAIENCRSAGLTRCESVRFENTCMSIASSVDGLYNTGEGTAEKWQIDRPFQPVMVYVVRRAASPRSCATARRLRSRPRLNQTDRPYHRNPKSRHTRAAARSRSQFWPRQRSSSWLVAYGTSYPSSRPRLLPCSSGRLQFHCGLAVPAAVAFAMFAEMPYLVFSYDATQALFFLFLWTNVFVALMIGCVLRLLLSPTWRSPDPLSLPLATLAFTIFTAIPLDLFALHGVLLTPPDCDSPPYSYLSVCGYFQLEGYYGCAVAFILLIICGSVLSINSNLVLAYNHLNAFVRKSLREFFARRRERQAQRESSAPTQ